MNVFDKGLIVVLACAGVFALLAIPLILRKVPRNVVYGFRTRATLGDDFLWFETNAHFGRKLLIACVVSAIAILVLYNAGLSPALFINASVAALVVPGLLAVFATSRYLRRLPPRESARRRTR